MAEVLATVIAIATAAMQLSKSTYDTISGFRSLNPDVKAVQDDIAVLGAVLEQIRTEAEASRNDGQFRILWSPLLCCEKVLQDIDEQLKDCTKNANDHRTSVRTWIRMTFHEKSFSVYKQRLSNYKATLCIAFDAMKMQEQHIMQTTLDNIVHLTKLTQDGLDDQLDYIQKKISEAEDTLRATLEDDRSQLQSCLKTLEEAQKSCETRVHIITDNNHAIGERSQLLAGTSNMQPTFNLSASHNRAENGALNITGVWSNEVVNTALQRSYAPQSTISIVQALQTGTFDPYSVEVGSPAQRQQNQRSVSLLNAPWTIEDAPDLQSSSSSTLRESGYGVAQSDL